MLFNKGLSVKNAIKLSLISLLIPFSAFPIDHRLSRANELFRDKSYETAYEHFSWYLFQYGKGCEAEDYFVAMIGKNSCIKYLDKEKLFSIERTYFEQLLDCSLPPEQEQLLADILHNSVFWDIENEPKETDL